MSGTVQRVGIADNIDSDSGTVYNCGMSDDRATLSIEELARTADVPVRTIRYYVAEGLVPGPGARGKGATYGPEHLARLLLIRRLTERHVPLAEIRRLVERLSPEETRALLYEEEQRRSALPPNTAALSPKEYISGLLERARASRSPDSGARFRTSSSAPDTLPRAQPATPSEGPRPLGAWERFELAPGLELHVRTPLDERRRRLVERLTQVAREAQSEDSGRDSR